MPPPQPPPPRQQLTKITEFTAVSDDDMQEIAFANRGCICSSWIPCYSSQTSPSWWEQIRSPENKSKWWSRGWMKLREWSEIVAGPKWKTFIRRFNNNKNRNNGSLFVKQGSFNYDPLSYSLNFDDGNDDEEDYNHRYGGFSARFANVPSSAKSSMDLGKDSPSFT